MKTITMIILLTATVLMGQTTGKFYSTSGSISTDTVDVANVMQSGKTSFEELGLSLSYNIMILADDTLEVSTASSFPSGQTFKLLPSGFTWNSGSGTALTLNGLDPRRIKDFYLRVYGTGTVNYIILITGM